MSDVIAVVALATGEAAYYDALTRIHLTLERPSAEVYRGFDVTGLRRALRNKTIVLVRGSLEPQTDQDTSSSSEKEQQPKKDVAPKGSDDSKKADEEGKPANKPMQNEQPAKKGSDDLYDAIEESEEETVVIGDDQSQEEEQRMCQAKTQSGRQCKRPALEGSDFCAVHQNK